MEPVFHRSTSSNSVSSTSQDSSRRTVNTEEIIIENFDKAIDIWKIPEVKKHEIYEKSNIFSFKNDFVIKTEERDIQISKSSETIPLLSQKTLQKFSQKGFKFIHLGLVQVGFKPLTREGLNTSILATLRDTRFTNFADSLLSSIESSLCRGPISFDCYPNLTISLKDKNILKSLVLQIQTHNYKMLEGSIPIAIIYRLHFKVMHSAFASKIKMMSSTRGETLLLQTDLTRSNAITTKTIQWKDVNLPDEWDLENAVPAQPYEPTRPNTEVKNIQQFADGRVKLSFHRDSSSFRSEPRSETSSKSTIDLGRISQIPSVIGTKPRFSTSDLPKDFPSTSNFANADYSTQIPKPVYVQNFQRQPKSPSEHSEPVSPDFSAVTENLMANELNVLEEEFVVNKQFLRNDFYSKENSEKRIWFFNTFPETKQQIQKEYYDFIIQNKIHIFFFDWFEIHSANHDIKYPFKNSLNPVTLRSNNPDSTEWETSVGAKITANHPPLQNIKLSVSNKSVEATPFKTPGDDNLKKIVTQNNFSNIHLSTIGKQLDRIEKHVKKQPFQLSKKDLKNPVFKPYLVSKDSVKNIQQNKNGSQKQSSKVSVGDSNIVLETPPSTSKSPVINTLSQKSEVDETTDQSKSPQINMLPNLPITPMPDIVPAKPLSQFRFNASSVYEWNIDNFSEYQILSTLQQMTMAANAYRTQNNVSDKAIAEILIAGFSGQLKGWWDNYLSPDQQNEILNAYKTDEEGNLIFDEDDNLQQDALSTLILTISLHFIGDPSHIKDKNAELLSNLRCKKLSHFQSYKNNFLTRVMLREDSNQPFWKEKFLAGLPTLLGEKVRNHIKETSKKKIIPYDDYTYGQLVGIIQHEGLKICQDLKLQKHLKKEIKQTKIELGTFCQQFDINPFKKSGSSCQGNCDRGKSKGYKKPFKKNYKTYKKPSKEDFYKKPLKKTKTSQPKPFSKSLKDVKCFKCQKFGHTARYCRLNRKIHELNLGDDILSKLSNLLISSPDNSSNSETEFSSVSKENRKCLQIDEVTSSKASSNLHSSSGEDNGLTVHVLTSEQQTILDIINQVDSPELRKECLEKLLKTFTPCESSSKPSSQPIISKNTYDLTSILNKQKRKSKDPTIQDLQKEIGIVKQDLRDLKQKQKQDEEAIKQILSKIDSKEESSSNEEENPIESNIQTLHQTPNEFLFILREITTRKYMIKVTLEFSPNYRLDTIALFDTGADLNCIKSGMVPSKFLEKSYEKLSAANNAKLSIQSKTFANIINNDISLKTAFVVVQDIHHSVILGTPFINIITPYKVNSDSISFKINHKKFLFSFLDKPKTRNLGFLKALSVYKNTLNNIVQAKDFQLQDLRKNISFKRIQNQLNTSFIKNQIKNLQKSIEDQICADLPNAFWNRKQHIVDLPYEDSFSDKQIPTKARPIQMNHELEEHCKKEIQDLLDKKLISKSRSPWSCAAFYVNKASEIERGVPRLVINYKPLNDALKWIRYPIPNKKDLFQKLYDSLIFSKFDMKSGFWQIQISPKDRYKTAFTVPFGQFEWNVMPFGLKNAPSEFQKVMNDIFSPYSKFCIVYIDDVLIFSKTIDEHFKHLKTFLCISKKNGIVVSKSKISIFQTKIRFLGHYITQGTITPIERCLQFGQKFPDQILDKKQLQRFLGCLNYVLDFFPNVNRLAKPLHDRLKKSPAPWTSVHTATVQHIKSQVLHLPCLHIANPYLPKVVQTDASELGFGGILLQVQNNQERIVQFTSGHWNQIQINYSTIKKEILSIVLCIQKFQSDLLNQKFLLRIDCKSAKEVLKKDVQNLASKQIFARWQAILSIFEFDIDFIKGDTNSLPDFLTREFLQNRSNASQIITETDGQRQTGSKAGRLQLKTNFGKAPHMV